MQAADSRTHCNHTDQVKHENVHTDIMIDNWASVDIAYVSQNDSFIKILKSGNPYADILYIC